MRVDLRPYSIPHLDSSLDEVIEILEPKVVATVETPQLSTAVQHPLIDSGSYATYFFTSTHLPHTPHNLRGVGGAEIPASHARAFISIQADGKKYSWEANILLTHVQVAAVFGYVGFFEFFTVAIDSEHRIVTIEPNAHFPGKVGNIWSEE